MACHQMGARRPTIRDLGSMATTPTAMGMRIPQQPNPSPAAWFLDDDDDGAASSGYHFLDDCHMCGRYLQRDHDIYMYKGDTPFCSEDCRDEQIRIDELQERTERRRRAKAAAASGSPSVSAQVKTRADAVAVGAL